MSSVRARADASDIGSPASGAHLSAVAGEHEWVRRIRAGDERAFDALYREYHGLLYTFVLGYVRVADEAEELVQDVMCWVWEHRARWEIREADVRRYLFVAARNRALNHLRRARADSRRAQHDALDAPAAGMGQGTGGTDDRVRGAELVRAAGRVVEMLPPRCREAYLLRVRDRIPNAEVARRMRVTVKCVEAQVTKALRVLRRELAPFFSDGMDRPL